MAKQCQKPKGGHLKKENDAIKFSHHDVTCVRTEERPLDLAMWKMFGKIPTEFPSIILIFVLSLVIIVL